MAGPNFPNISFFHDFEGEFEVEWGVDEDWKIHEDESHTYSLRRQSSSSPPSRSIVEGKMESGCPIATMQVLDDVAEEHDKPDDVEVVGIAKLRHGGTPLTIEADNIEPAASTAANNDEMIEVSSDASSSLKDKIVKDATKMLVETLATSLKEEITDRLIDDITKKFLDSSEEEDTQPEKAGKEADLVKNERK